jgi:hypothetical protein
MEVSGQLHTMAAFSPEKKLGIHWVGSRAGLDILEKNKKASRESNPRFFSLLSGH